MSEDSNVNAWSKTQNNKEKVQYIIRKRSPNLYSKLILKDFPVNIMIETVSLCNAKCIMCPHGYYGKDKMPKGSMSDELFDKILDEIKNYPVNSVLPFFFGESLIDKQFEERIEKLRFHLPNINIILHTNGSLLTKERAERLVNAGLTRIHFSFEAIRKETYEKIMPGLNYENTLESIKYFLSLKRPDSLEVKMGLIRHNYLSDEEFDEYVDFWNSIDDRVIVEAPDRASSFGGTLQDDNIVRKMDNKSTETKLVGCHEDRHLKWIHIVSNGDVVLCCVDWNRKVILGNVQEQSIYDIWHSEKYHKVRQILLAKEPKPDKFICTNCEVAVFK